MRRNAGYWSDELVHSELISICAGSGMFPSNHELQQLGRGDLANQISRRGGFVNWSKRLGYERRESDSDFGWHGESQCLNKLKSKGFKAVRASGIRAPYDILVADCLRLDIKTANFAEYGRCRGWFYRVGKHMQSDVGMFYQADTGIAYLVPWFLCPSTNITISRDGGKYKHFKDNFEILESMVAQRMEEKTKLSALIIP